MKEKLKFNKIIKYISSLIIYVFTILVLITLIYVVYDNITNNANVWKSSIIEILPIIIAILFAYYYVERNNDKRKQKEIIEKNIIKIQKYIYDEEIYKVKNKTISNSLTRSIKIRKINNLISNLKAYSKKYKFSSEIEKIYNDFKKYQALSENMNQDNDYSKKSINNLIRIIETIDDNLEEILHLIYL